MELLFANPAGWWALLGVPAVLAIHFLQRKSRRVVTSTLFLLDQMSPVSAQGRRVERLRNSIPLWLQLLAVLILAWLLAGPRWLRSDSAQTVAVVLDSSISMKASRQAAIDSLMLRLEALSHSAACNEWVLTESDLTRPTLYSGGDLAELRRKLDEWLPSLGTHDSEAALRVAQSLLRSNGVAVFVSDRAHPLPDGVRMLAVGEPFDNVGFIGLRIEGGKWTALVRNHGAHSQTRSWHIETAGQSGPAATLTLDAGQTKVIGGELPKGVDRCELVLDADSFDSDDRLPIVRPDPKRLDIAIQLATPLNEFFKHFAASIPNAEEAAFDKADLRLARYDPLAPVTVPSRTILALADSSQSSTYLSGPIIAEEGPLTEGLSWQGLLCRDTLTMPSKPGDEVLLWQGDRPLILLRGRGDDRSLVINFDINQSNADRLPAFIVLLNRFVEDVRRAKIAPERINAETNQAVTVATRNDAPAAEVRPGTSAAGVLKTSGDPGFFEVAQGQTKLVDGAAHFGDPREADFRDAASIDTIDEAKRVQAERNSREDFLTPVWLLLLGVVLIANWGFSERGRA
jgi:hypothetical protein